MKVQSALQMNNYELQNAVVQNQGGFAEHDWRKGQLQFDSTQNVDKLAVGIDSGQGAEGSKYRYLLDSRANGVSNEMLAGFSNTTSDIESALANFFPSCAAVRNFVNALVSSALIYKGTVTPESLKKNTITVDADDYRYAGTAASGTYRHRWYNGNVYRYTATSTPAVGERAYSDTAGSYSFTIADVLSKLYADMFVESGVARSTLPTTKGWLYKSSGSGYFGSVAVETGDSFICNGGTAHTAADYDIVQTNIDLLNIPELGVTASEVARLTLSAGGEGSRKSAVIDANDNGLLTISPYTNVEVDGSVLPAEDGDYNLGSTSKKWASLHAGTVYEDGTALASKYYLATNPSGFISGITKAMVEAVLTGSISSHSHAYLPLSGGLITGTIQMNSEVDNAPLVRNWTYTSTTGWSREIAAFKVDGNSKFYIGAYGQYTVGAEDNGIEYAYIGCNSYNGLNLRISPRSLKWGINDIYHSGNLTPSDYLKKAEGGTITNNLQVGQSGSGNGKYLDVFGSLFTDKLYLGHHNSPGTPYFLYEGDYGVKCDDPIEASAFYENGASLSDKYAPKASTPKMFRADITGNGQQSSFPITHNLGTQSPIVQIYEASSHEQVLVDVVANAANTVQVKFGAAPANGKVYNVVIMG